MTTDCQIHFHTMTSPNTNSLMTLLNNAVRNNPKPATVVFKTVYVGKDKTPLIILEMAPVGGDVRKKSGSFESMSSTVRG